MFKSANEIKIIAEKNLQESTPFQQGVATVSETIANNIEMSATEGKFTTNAYFEGWYVEKHFKIIETVIKELRMAGYNVTDLMPDTEFNDNKQYFKISWRVK